VRHQEQNVGNYSADCIGILPSKPYSLVEDCSLYTCYTMPWQCAHSSRRRHLAALELEIVCVSATDDTPDETLDEAPKRQPDRFSGLAVSVRQACLLELAEARAAANSNGTPVDVRGKDSIGNSNIDSR